MMWRCAYPLLDSIVAIASRLRRATSLGVAVALVGAMLVAASAPAGAARPATAQRSATFSVGGETFRLDIILPARHVRAVNGPVKIVVTMPKGVAGSVASVASMDAGFNSHGYDIRFGNGANEDGKVVFAVTVPATNSRIATEVALSAASGYASAVPGRTNVSSLLEGYV